MERDEVIVVLAVPDNQEVGVEARWGISQVFEIQDQGHCPWENTPCHPLLSTWEGPC